MQDDDNNICHRCKGKKLVKRIGVSADGRYLGTVPCPFCLGVLVGVR